MALPAGHGNASLAVVSGTMLSLVLAAGRLAKAPRRALRVLTSGKSCSDPSPQCVVRGSFDRADDDSPLQAPFPQRPARAIRPGLRRRLAPGSVVRVLRRLSVAARSRLGSRQAAPSRAELAADPAQGRRWPRRVVWPAVMGLVAVIAIAVGLRVTPLQTVTAAGQVIEVGATAPTFSLSGPGQVDLFGQSLPTKMDFPGPVRPRLQLTRITINSQLANFVQNATPAHAKHVVGDRLAAGWTRYFLWETAITGLAALALLAAVAGWRRLPRRATIKLLAAGLVVAEGINLGAIMITAYQAPGSLRQVRSLTELVGSTPGPAQDAAHPAPTLPGVQAVVLGDSTAAGAGLPPVADASSVDRSCGRSANSYAQDLAHANSWKVLNLACDSATIQQGLLGPQQRGARAVPAQLNAAERARGVSVVIVSVGADDLDWSLMVRYCAAAPSCDDRASTAFFQQQLSTFSKDYLQLLSALAEFPGHPRVIINRYYDPFGQHQGCLRKVGLTKAKIATLTSRLAALNKILATGASEFGFASAQPDFAGHQLCSKEPFVQGLGSPAPFHPTSLGQFAIALADQAALRAQRKG